MAVFKGDKMIGRLDNAASKGYVWAMGNVTDGAVEVKDGQDEAVLQAVSIDTKKRIDIRPDGGVARFLVGRLYPRGKRAKGVHKMPATEAVTRLVKYD